MSAVETEPHAEKVKTRLVERLGGTQDTGSYSVAEVRTPQGLWNVYIVSRPPQEIGVRQSRQNAEVEFGMNETLVWRDFFERGHQELEEDWRWFLRNHDFVRLPDLVNRWRAIEFIPGPARCASADCGELELEDEYGLPVRVELEQSGMPVEIRMSAPARFGGGKVVFRIEEWMRIDQRSLPRIFEQRAGEERMRWIFHAQEPLEDPAQELLPWSLQQSRE